MLSNNQSMYNVCIFNTNTVTQETNLCDKEILYQSLNLGNVIFNIYIFFQTIFDPGCAAGLQSTWGLGNQLFVFPGRKPTLEPGNYNVEINFLLETVVYDHDNDDPQASLVTSLILRKVYSQTSILYKIMAFVYTIDKHVERE